MIALIVRCSLVTSLLLASACAHKTAAQELDIKFYTDSDIILLPFSQYDISSSSTLNSPPDADTVRYLNYLSGNYTKVDTKTAGGNKFTKIIKIDVQADGLQTPAYVVWQSQSSLLLELESKIYSRNYGGIEQLSDEGTLLYMSLIETHEKKVDRYYRRLFDEQIRRHP